MLCKCGCEMDARWLITGEDYDGTWFTDEPACDSSAFYCREASAELRLPFTMRPYVAEMNHETT